MSPPLLPPARTSVASQDRPNANAGADDLHRLPRPTTPVIREEPFIPTSSSWLNMIERWFGELTDKTVRRGAFASVNELITAIHEFLDAGNEQPKPFIWTATVESIADKVNRGKAKLETHH